MMSKYGRSLIFIAVLIFSTSNFAFARGNPSPKPPVSDSTIHTRMRIATLSSPRQPQGPSTRVDIPVRLYVADSPEKTYILASLGAFPFDLTAVRSDFMSQDFFERFWNDTVSSRVTSQNSGRSLKIEFLPQHDVNERECIFRDGEVTGQMYVLVTDDKVFVLCVFGVDQNDYNVAAAKRLFESLRQQNG